MLGLVKEPTHPGVRRSVRRGLPPLTLPTNSARRWVVLDVDLLEVQACALHLRLQPDAVAAPGCWNTW